MILEAQNEKLAVCKNLLFIIEVSEVVDKGEKSCFRYIM